MERSEAYQFTTADRNDPQIAELKHKIAFCNKLQREAARMVQDVYPLWRVRLMPRGPRVEAAWADYKSRRAYDSYLPMRHATHYDVYVHRDTTAEWMMQREFDTGLTPGQLRRLDREQNALRLAEWDMQKRLREAGIYGSWDGNGYVSSEKRIAELRDKGVPESFIERMVG